MNTETEYRAQSKSTEIKEGCGDAIAEIVFSLIFCVIGAIVLSLFGVGKDVEWLDEDLLMLIGIGVIFIPAVIISAVVHTVRKKKRRISKKIEINSKNNDEENDFGNSNRKEQDGV